ncbi:hypothetical protein ABVK25_004780 [Lepraria finkii]|uniref:Uncharacterized protein n=1 Tax=Lepraria finkii TaxID=1340010 RepID=A0ABR4BAR8_9LECA
MAILLASSLVFIPPCTGYVNWIYPTARSTSLTYNYIDTVYFTWTSNITNPTLGLWCATANSQTFVSPPPWASTVPMNGSIAQSFPYGKYFNGTCHMDLYSPEPGAAPGISSPNFLLAHVPTAAAQTWGLTATSLAVSSPAGTESSGGTARGSSGLSKSAQAVVGVVCAIGGCFFMLRERET